MRCPMWWWEGGAGGRAPFETNLFMDGRVLSMNCTPLCAGLAFALKQTLLAFAHSQIHMAPPSCLACDKAVALVSFAPACLLACHLPTRTVPCNAYARAAHPQVLEMNLSPRQAWDLSGQPGGTAGIQNIRKRARVAAAAKARRAGGEPDDVGAGEAEAAASPPVPPGLPAQSPVSNQPAFRRKPYQVDKAAIHDAKLKASYVEALKAASLEHSATQAKGGCRNGSERSAKATPKPSPLPSTPTSTPT